MSDDIHIILFLLIINVRLYSWPLRTVHNLMRQHIWGEVVVLIPFFPKILSEFNSEKRIWKLVHVCRSYHKNKSGTYFLRHGVYRRRSVPLVTTFWSKGSRHSSAFAILHSRGSVDICHATFVAVCRLSTSTNSTDSYWTRQARFLCRSTNSLELT